LSAPIKKNLNPKNTLTTDFADYHRLKQTIFKKSVIKGGGDMDTEKVTIYTERFMIVGEVAITRKGYRKRLSDFLNDKDVQFVPIIKAKLSPLDMKRDTTEVEIMILNKNEIVMVMPEKSIEF